MNKSLRGKAGSSTPAAFIAVLFAAFAGQLQADTIYPTVNVTVYTTPPTPPSGGACKQNGSKTYWICISKDPIDLKGYGRPVTIPWEVGSAGWTFTTPPKPKGVAITGGGWNEHQGATAKDYEARSNAVDKKQYPYKLTITNGNAVETFDPFIWNN